MYNSRPAFSGSNFDQKWWKNEVSRKCPGSSQNVSRVSGRLQNTTKCPGTSEMIKLEKLKISIQTEGLGYYMSRGGSIFHTFAHLLVQVSSKSVGWMLRKINFKICHFPSLACHFTLYYLMPGPLPLLPIGHPHHPHRPATPSNPHHPRANLLYLALVFGHLNIFGYLIIFGFLYTFGFLYIFGNSQFVGNLWCFGYLCIFGYL